MSEIDPSPWPRRLGITLLVAGSALFSFLNAGERVTLNFGLFSIYRISLVGLVFAVFLLGMATMFLFSLRHDRQVRRILEQHRDGPEPVVEPLTEPINEEPYSDPYM